MEELRDQLKALPKSVLYDLASLYDIHHVPYKEFVKEKSKEFQNVMIPQLGPILRDIWLGLNSEEKARYDDVCFEAMVTSIAVLITKQENTL